MVSEGSPEQNRGLVGYTGKPAGKRPSIKEDDRLFPFSNSVASAMLTTVIAGPGSPSGPRRGSTASHSHTRKFSYQFGQAAGPDAAETIMGHSPGPTANYRLLEEAQLAPIFKKYETSLTIHRDKDTEARQRAGGTAERTDRSPRPGD